MTNLSTTGACAAIWPIIKNMVEISGDGGFDPLDVKCQMSKTFIGDAVCREFESEAPVAEENMLDRSLSYAAENSSVFRYALKLVMVAELFGS